MNKYESHSAASSFPMLEGEDYEQFKADIKDRGLLEPIYLYDGKILDGRNRYRACIELGIAVTTREYTGDSPIAFAWSLNGARRHLTHGQRTAIAVEMLPALQGEARKRMSPGTNQYSRSPTALEETTCEATAQAASIVGVSKTSVYQAKAVKDRDPALFDKIKSGEVPVERAYKNIKDTPMRDGRSERKPNQFRVDQIKQLVAEGHRTEQIAANLGIQAESVRAIAKRSGIKLADAAISKSHRIKAARVIERTVTTIEGCALGLQTIGFNFSDVTAAQAKQWADSLTEPLKRLALLRKKLLEISDD